MRYGPYTVEDLENLVKVSRVTCSRLTIMVTTNFKTFELFRNFWNSLLSSSPVGFLLQCSTSVCKSKRKKTSKEKDGRERNSNVISHTQMSSMTYVSIFLQNGRQKNRKTREEMGTRRRRGEN